MRGTLGSSFRSLVCCLLVVAPLFVAEGFFTRGNGKNVKVSVGPGRPRTKPRREIFFDHVRDRGRAYAQFGPKALDFIGRANGNDTVNSTPNRGNRGDGKDVTINTSPYGDNQRGRGRSSPVSVRSSGFSWHHDDFYYDDDYYYEDDDYYYDNRGKGKGGSEGAKRSKKAKKSRSKRGKGKSKSKGDFHTFSPGPTATLSPAPSPAPSAQPSAGPSYTPSSQPSTQPSPAPSPAPSAMPTFSLAPSSRPSNAPSEAPSVVPVAVILSIFTIRYDTATELIPSFTDYAEAERLTEEHVQEYLEMVFGLVSATTFSSVVISSVSIGNTPTRIAFEGTVEFAPESTFVPTQNDLDMLVNSAFEQPAVGPFLSTLRSLPSTNVFATTTSVAYLPGNTTPRVQVKETVGPETSTHVSYAFAGIVFLAINLLGAAMMYRRGGLSGKPKSGSRNSGKYEIANQIIDQDLADQQETSAAWSDWSFCASYGLEEDASDSSSVTDGSQQEDDLEAKHGRSRLYSKKRAAQRDPLIEKSRAKRESMVKASTFVR